jgi:MFS superfamily sulfate permease-like transporter
VLAARSQQAHIHPFLMTCACYSAPICPLAQPPLVSSPIHSDLVCHLSCPACPACPACFAFAGALRLASLVQYVPLPVIGGYLAFVGYFCLAAGGWLGG